MNWRVVLRPRAESDLEKARDWYDEHQTGLGMAFLDDVDLAIAQFNDAPLALPEYHRGFRRVLLRKFPYKIFDRVHDDAIVVFRILHARRDHPAHLRKP
jgi:plasmid stabilization system protein ParE